MNWCLVLYKLQLRRPMLWLQILILVLLLWLVQSVSVLQADQLDILLCNEDGAFAQRLMERLQQNPGAFHFREVESREELYKELTAGSAECGFICKQGLEEGLEQEKPRGLVTFVSVSGSRKSAGASETFYQELFSMYSDILLEHRAEEIFEPKDLKEVLVYLKERNEYYQNSDRVFQVIYETVGSASNQGSQVLYETAEYMDGGMREEETDPVRGIVAIVILLQMLLICGEEKTAGAGGYEACLPVGERRVFRLQKYLTAAVPLAITAIICYSILKINDHLIFEVLKMIGFLLFSAIWVLIIGGRIKSRIAYYGCLCPLIGLNLLLPPVFFQWSVYVPAVRWLNMLLPVGVYLK